MANPGEVVTVWEGQNGLNWKGYTEPAKACFRTSNLPVINQEEVDKTKALLTQEADVNGDGIPDQFRIVETKDYFLALLYRGVKYTHVWESGCGGGASGGENSYTEPELKGQLVGAIAKNSALQRKIAKIAWQEIFSDEKKVRRLVVSGLEVYDNRPKETKWNFASIDCSEIPREGSFCP